MTRHRLRPRPHLVALEGRFAPAIFTVLNTLDAGIGSLRQAVLDANASKLTADTIVFDATAFVGSQTITLTTGKMLVTDPLAIEGPGSGRLTVDAKAMFGGQFTVDVPGIGQPFSLSGVTLTNGRNNLGGSINAADDMLVLRDVTIRNSSANSNGGAIFIGTGGVLDLSGCSFFDNAGWSGSNALGGAILASSSKSVRADHCTFSGNKVGAEGGAICALQTPLTLSYVQFIGNSAGYGGAVDFSVSLSNAIDHCTFSSNTAGIGGAIYGLYSSLVITDSAFIGNKAGSKGGGVYFSTSITCRNTTFSENVAGSGGGMHVTTSLQKTMILEGNTFTGNKATSPVYGGGGLLLYGNSNHQVQNCTFSGNTSAYTGGGIQCEGSSTLTIRNCTIVGNSAYDGGGIGFRTATVALESTIVSNNIGNQSDLPSFINARVTAKDSAIGSIAGVASFTDLGGNLPFGTDLKLGPLADNGGPTKTIALLPGSPCLDAGSNPGGLATDQRGYARSFGVTDIGAYELGAAGRVVAVTVNAGAAQRSRVTQLAVAYDQIVGLPADPAAAFQLVRIGDAAPVMLAATVANGSTSTVTLTFIGGAVEAGSLADGRYTLTVLANLVATAGGALDGNGDGVGGDNFVQATGIARLFGDANGDGDVDTGDFTAFAAAYGSGPSNFDADGDGDTDVGDFVAFRGRFGTVLP